MFSKILLLLPNCISELCTRHDYEWASPMTTYSGCSRAVCRPRWAVLAQSHTSTWGSVPCSWNQGEEALRSASFRFFPEEPKHPFVTKRTLLRSLSPNCLWLLLLRFGSAFPFYLFNTRYAFQNIFHSCQLLAALYFHPYLWILIFFVCFILCISQLCWHFWNFIDTWRCFLLTLVFFILIFLSPFLAAFSNLKL